MNRSMFIDVIKGVCSLIDNYQNGSGDMTVEIGEFTLEDPSTGELFINYHDHTVSIDITYNKETASRLVFYIMEALEKTF